MIFPSVPARDSALQNKIQSSSYLPDILIQPLIYSIPIEGDLFSSLFTGDNILFWTNFLSDIYTFCIEENLQHSMGQSMMETLPLEPCYLSGHFDIFAKSWKCNEDTQRREISNIISYFRSLSNVMLASSGVSQVIFYTDLKEIFDSAKTNLKGTHSPNI